MSRPGELSVRPLSPEEEQWVHRLYDHTTHGGVINRCHSILLSKAHSSVPQIAAVLFTSEDTVARCIVSRSIDLVWKGSGVLAHLFPQAQSG